MVITVYIIVSLLVITKLCDVLSTLRRIQSPYSEANPLARKFMLQIGTTKTIWLVFLIAIVIIGVAGVLAILGGLAFQILFIILGGMIASIQFAVALCNWTGHDNFTTRNIRRFHSIVHR